MTNTKPQVIFFGNGPLADYALAVLSKHFDILFRAKTREDLAQVKAIKSSHPAAHGILASYGIIVKQNILDLFEPEGILNIHPSLLPKYRGSSPIETAILNNDTSFSVSIMKLVKAMDAGPIFYQTTLQEQTIFNDIDINYAPEYKPAIYQKLATTSAEWIVQNLVNLPSPVEQSGQPSFTQKFDKSMSLLDPKHKTASELLAQIRAFSGFPKSKYTFFDQECIIISAHVANSDSHDNKSLSITCYDGSILIIDQIQPAGRKIMDAKSFLNGYKK